MKKIIGLVLVLALAFGTAAFGAEYKPTKSLVLYTSASTSEYELIVGLFKKANPDIEVEIVIAGTGELSSKIVAESGNPQGDVLMGGGALHHPDRDDGGVAPAVLPPHRLGGY